MRKIDVWPEARDFIAALPVKHARQVVRKLEELARHPHPPTSKLLEGYPLLRRLRAGDYRIIYFDTAAVLSVPLIDRRNDDKVYKRLKQMFG